MLHPTDPPRTRRSARSRLGHSALIVLLIGAIGLLIPTPASATQPSTPTGVHVESVSSSEVIVALNRTPNARYYRLFISPTKSSVYVANISRARHSGLTPNPRIGAIHLTYMTAPYYYRVEAVNGSSRSWSPIYSVGLMPATPTGLRIYSSSTGGTYLTWHSAAATGFAIAQGTNALLSQGRVNYTIHAGQNRQFTPYGLVKGRTYYFRVAAVNQTTKSHYSALISVTNVASLQPVRVMTYNILEATNDGHVEGGQKIAPWSQRRAVVAALINQAHPDAVAIQEAAAYVAPGSYNRQIDSLKAALGSTYTLATTEVKPPAAGYRRMASYILYKTSAYSAVGAGGHIIMSYAGQEHFAAYQVLQSRTTGARFLLVSTHLAVGSGTAGDTARQAETSSLISQAGAIASAAHVPIVYAGDFNSAVDPNHGFDGPGRAMSPLHIADAFDTAQITSNHQFNSANQYLRVAPAFSDSIDHIYAPPGIGIVTWRQVVNLSRGRFVGVMGSDHNPVLADLQFPY